MGDITGTAIPGGLQLLPATALAAWKKYLWVGFFRLFLRWTDVVLPHMSIFFLPTPDQMQSPSYRERQMSNSSAVTEIVLL